MDIKEFAQKYIQAQTDAWLQGKVDAFDELEHPDVVYHFQVQNLDRAGLEGHKQFLIGIHKALTSTRIDWKYLTGEGNLFAVSYSARGMFTGKFPEGPPPTGKEATISEMFLCRLEKGKIAEVWVSSTGASTGIG